MPFDGLRILLDDTLHVSDETPVHFDSMDTLYAAFKENLRTAMEQIYHNTVVRFTGKEPGAIWAVSYTHLGAKSFKGTSHASWNRFKLMNIMDTLTEDMIGIDYKITFYLKANRTGYFNIGLIGDNSNKTYGATPYMSTKIDVDTANEWKKYTYTFTVDQEIVDNNINFLLIGPQFGQKMTDTTDETSGKKYSVPVSYTHLTARYEVFYHVVFVHIGRVMTCNKV